MFLLFFFVLFDVAPNLSKIHMTELQPRSTVIQARREH